MKLLLAECCWNLVVPSNEANDPRWCPCKTACVWWRDPIRGLISVHSSRSPERVSIIGLHNALLRAPIPSIGCVQRDAIRKLIDETDHGYLFKQVESLVVRIRPGSMASNDTEFVLNQSDVPKSNDG